VPVKYGAGILGAVPSQTIDDQAQALIAAIDTLARRLAPARRPQDREAPECSAQELRALSALSRSGRLTMSELAAELGTPISTATRIVDRLAGKGLAMRRDAPGDRRVVHVSFSARGKRIDRWVVEAQRSAARALLQALPTRDRSLVLERLRRMTRPRRAEPSDESR
jgi:DNA-binding MarR family transcriptional regulator